MTSSPIDQGDDVITYNSVMTSSLIDTMSRDLLQEKICDALINSVDTFDKTLIHDVTGLLLEDLVDSDDLKTFIEQYGIALKEAGEVIRTPLGKAMTMMSR